MRIEHKNLPSDPVILYEIINVLSIENASLKDRNQILKDKEEELRRKEEKILQQKEAELK
jgi:hypothetical protein